MQGLGLCDIFVRFQGKSEAPCTSHDSDKKEAWTQQEPYKEVRPLNWVGGRLSRLECC